MINKMDKLVSIIIPTYNSAKFLRDVSLPSVLKQSYKNLEVIVIDDGSTDDTRDVVSGFILNENFKYYYQDNKGQASARNLGIKLSTGEYVAFLDADDYWHPNKISKQLDLMLLNNSKGFCFCDFYEIKDGNRKYYSQNPGDSFLIDILMALKSVLPSTILIKREVLNRIGFFNEKSNLRYIEDIDFIIRLAASEEFVYLPEALVFYQSSIGKGGCDRLARFIDLIELYSIKHSNLIEGNYKKASIQYRFLGSGFIKTNRIGRGRKYLLKSLRYNYFNLLSGLYFLISIFGSNFFNFIFLIKQKFIKMNYSYQNKLVIFTAYVIDLAGGLLFLRKNNKIYNQSVRKILIVKIDNIGDCFLMSPLFTELKKINSGVKLDVLCLNASGDIFENNRSINKVFKINSDSFKDLFRVLKKIKEENYDIFIDARGYAKVALLGFCSGIKIRLGFLEEVLNFLYTNKIEYSRNAHESEKYSQLLSEFGIIDSDSWIPRLDLRSDINVDNFKINGQVLAIHPGASLAYKKWPIEKWVELLKRIINDNNDIDVVILGSKEEFKIAGKIVAGLPDSRVTNLAGKMNIAQNYLFLSKCFIFIGNDSALGHLAGPQGIATITLMNSVIDKNRWRPLGTKVEVISGKNEEHRCLYDQCPYPCPNMDSITVEDVLKKVNYFINLNK